MHVYVLGVKEGKLLLNHAYFHLLFCPTIDWAKDLVTLKIEILVIGFNCPELSKLLTCCPSLSLRCCSFDCLPVILRLGQCC